MQVTLTLSEERARELLGLDLPLGAPHLAALNMSEQFQLKAQLTPDRQTDKTLYFFEDMRGHILEERKCKDDSEASRVASELATDVGLPVDEITFYEAVTLTLDRARAREILGRYKDSMWLGTWDVELTGKELKQIYEQLDSQRTRFLSEQKQETDVDGQFFWGAKGEIHFGATHPILKGSESSVQNAVAELNRMRSRLSALEGKQ